jgi:hypothetical protein
MKKLNAGQERYLLQEMRGLEEFLYTSGLPMRQVNMATVYLAADLEDLLLELDIQVIAVDNESFIEFLKGALDEASV